MKAAHARSPRGLGAIGASLIAAILLAGGAAHAKPTKAAPQPADGVVNINTATAEQLVLLPGIGPTKAQRIIAYRGKRKFKAAHELVRVRGIGRRSYRKLAPYLTIKGPTTLTRKPKPLRASKS